MPNYNDNDYELLSSYLDDALSNADQTALEARLRAEPALREELEALRLVKQAVRTLPVLKAPRDFRLTPAMVQPQRPKVVAFPRRNSWWVSAAAALVVAVVGIGIFVTSTNTANPATGGEQIAAAPTNAPLGTATLAATNAESEVARQANELTATLSPDEIIADMVAISTTTNMMMPGVEPSAPVMLEVTDEETMLFSAVPMAEASLDTANADAQSEDSQSQPASAVGTPLAVIQQGTIATGTMPAMVGGINMPTGTPASTMTGMDVAGQSQAAQNVPPPAPTMSAANAVMIAPESATAEAGVMDMAIMAETAPADLSNATGAAASDLAETSTTFKGDLPVWWGTLGSIITILQTLYVLLSR